MGAPGLAAGRPGFQDQDHAHTSTATTTTVSRRAHRARSGVAGRHDVIAPSLPGGTVGLDGTGGRAAARPRGDSEVRPDGRGRARYLFLRLQRAPRVVTQCGAVAKSEAGLGLAGSRRYGSLRFSSREDQTRQEERGGPGLWLRAKEAAFAFAFGWTFQKDGEIKSRAWGKRVAGAGPSPSLLHTVSFICAGFRRDLRFLRARGVALAPRRVRLRCPR